MSKTNNSKLANINLEDIDALVAYILEDNEDLVEDKVELNEVLVEVEDINSIDSSRFVYEKIEIKEAHEDDLICENPMFELINCCNNLAVLLEH